MILDRGRRGRRPISVDQNIFYVCDASFMDTPVCTVNNGSVHYVSYGVLPIIFLNVPASYLPIL